MSRFFSGRCFNRMLNVGLLTGFVTLSGCAPLVSVSPEASVKAAVNERWAHLAEGRWAEAYAMLSPAYRALYTQRDYQNTFRGPVRLKSAKAVDVACEPDRCEARVELVVTSPLARREDDTLTTYITESWLLDGGRWYFVEK